MDSEVFESAPDDIPFGSNGLDQPTFFADYIRGTLISSGVVKLSFVENRLDALAGAVRTMHVVNIVVPLLQVRAWANYLKVIADQQGVPEIAAEPSQDG